MALTAKQSVAGAIRNNAPKHRPSTVRPSTVKCACSKQVRQLGSLQRPVLTVTQLQSELVPASNSTAFVQELSLLDQTVGGFPLYGAPLFFKASLSEDLLRASMQQTLGLYPPLCGRLHLEKNVLHVECNNAGAMLSLGTSPNSLAELLPRDLSRPFLACDCWGAVPGLPDTGNAFADTDEPLLRVSVISLADGATVIAAAGCHVVADFRTLASFLEHWAAAYRSLEACTHTDNSMKQHAISARSLAVERHSYAAGQQAECTPIAAAVSSSASSFAIAPAHPPILTRASPACSADGESGVVPYGGVDCTATPGTASLLHPTISAEGDARGAAPLPGGPPVWANELLDALAPAEAQQEDSVNADWTLWRLLGVVRGLLWANLTGGGCVMVSRVVSEARIRQLKAMADLHQQAEQDGAEFVSGHDCLLARIWQVIGGLPGRAHEPFPLHFVVDMRARLDPPLPPHACGNIISAAFAGCAGVPAELALGVLALEIRGSIGRCAASFPANLAWLQARRSKGLVGTILPRMLLPPQPLHDTVRGTAWVSQWALDHSKLQFGRAPECAPVFAVTAVPSTVLSAPHFLITQRVPAASGGGWQVSAMLTKRQAEAWVAQEL